MGFSPIVANNLAKAKNGIVILQLKQEAIYE